MAAVRVWAFERFEALKFDQNGFVTGIDDVHFFANLERLFEAATNHGMLVYLCLNSWSIHDSPEKVGIDAVRAPHYLALQKTWKHNMRLLLKNPSALDSFITNALTPLLNRVGGHPALFAIDLMNEPDNILDNERDDTSATEAEKVTENDIKRYIRSCSDAIHTFDSAIKVSCGFTRQETAKSYATEMAQYFDFFDYHVYNNEGDLEPYRPSDFGSKPCIIGEFGPYIKGHSEHDSGKEVSAVQNFMTNAQKSGYAGCLVWMSKDYNNWNGMLQSLQNFADEKRRIGEAPPPPPPPPPRCFIATAAMDSELHPHVQFLRDYRDSVILQSEYKDAFERLLSVYYRYSPAVAHSMKRHRPLKLLLRYGLVIPLVFSLKLLVALFKLMKAFQ